MDPKMFLLHEYFNSKRSLNFVHQVTGKAVMLDEIINYVQSLQRQVEVGNTGNIACDEIA